MLKCKNITLLFLFFLSVTGLYAQENIIQQKQDTIPVMTDSVLQESIAKEIQVVEDTIKVISIDSIASAVEDVLILDKKIFKPDSKKAVIYSAIFPGLGQIYNKKYWKLPILYGGFVGVTYSITWNNSHYVDYLEGYKSILLDDPNDPDPAWVRLLPYGRDPETVDKKWFSGVLNDRKNYFRYYRDLSIIIGVALYGLGIVDAYVDAQLFEFDVSPDLSMRIEPAVIQKSSKNNYLADSYGFVWTINF